MKGRYVGMTVNVDIGGREEFEWKGDFRAVNDTIVFFDGSRAAEVCRCSGTGCVVLAITLRDGPS